MLVVAVLSVGRRCVIAARRHFEPVESDETLMSLVHHHPLQFPDSNSMAKLFFFKLLSLSSHGASFSCAEQRRVWWFGGVGDGVAGGGCTW